MKKVLLMLMLLPMLVSAKSLSDGLVAWYKFDGDANDSSDNHLNGYVFGATPSPDRFGRKDHALMFGDGKYVLVPNDMRLQDLCEKISVSVWIFPLEWYYGHWGPILCKGHMKGRIPIFNMEMVFDGCKMWLATGGHSLKKTPSLNKWHHVLFTYDGNSVEIYIDGIMEVSQKIDTTVRKASATDDSLSIGCDPPGHNEYFIGAMDDLRIYNRPLSRDEVISLYRERKTTNDSQESNNKQIDHKDAEDNGMGDSNSSADTEIADEMDETEDADVGQDKSAKTQDATEEPMFAKPTDVPNDVEVAKAVKVMVELFGDDQKAVKAGKMSQSEFAVKLMSYVRKTDNIAVKFVLLRTAYKRLLMAKSVSSAQKLFDKVEIKYGARFAVAMAKAGDANLKSLLKSAKTAGAAQKLSAQIDELSVCMAKIKAAEDILKKSPAEARPKRDKAFNCLKIGDWPAAFALYSEMNDERGKVVRWELAKPNERSKDYTAEKVGDYWWSTIADAKEGSALFRSVSRHAAYWYRQAMKEGGMSEMKVELVKKRIGHTTANKITSSSTTSMHTSTSKTTDKGDVNNEKGEHTSMTYVLIKTAEHGGVDCRYTQEIPSGSWLSRWFDDSRWLRGHTEIDRDVWNTSDVWIRVLFDCPVDPKSIEKFILRYHVDDDIEVWINEMPAYRHCGYHREYFDITLKIDRRKIKQKGNIICVHAHDTAGGRRNYNSLYVDFGLSIVAPKKQ